MIENQLTISIVTFYPDCSELTQALDCLQAAITRASQTENIDTRVCVIDNSQNQLMARQISGCLKNSLSCPFDLIVPETNLGYGAGHNLCICHSDSQWHLVLNADVYLDQQAISQAVRFLNHSDHQHVSLVTPFCTTGDGQRAYLCKRYPSIIDLALRGFAPDGLKKIFHKRLKRYEYRQETELQSVNSIVIASGCFMFFNAEILRQLNGFSPEYFLYFEDFDLSLRLNTMSQIAYVPDVKVIHYGGHAARKGVAHIILFMQSAYRFFSTHGWKLY
ncbi:MAG: glycosyltransferase [Gammaproteobacteria bacterium]|nr:glycosyltransferase [Gammaproteobacteria bacterium]